MNVILVKNQNLKMVHEINKDGLGKGYKFLGAGKADQDLTLI